MLCGNHLNFSNVMTIVICICFCFCVNVHNITACFQKLHFSFTFLLLLSILLNKDERKPEINETRQYMKKKKKKFLSDLQRSNEKGSYKEI